MKAARIVLALCAALALGIADAQAGGHRGGIAVRGHGGAGVVAPRFHAFQHPPRTRVFIGGSFFFWPRPYYYYYPYYPAPAAYYAPVPAAPLMVDPYWYYCEQSAAYYPYVQDCPGGWQRVLPPAASLG